MWKTYKSNTPPTLKLYETISRSTQYSSHGTATLSAKRKKKRLLLSLGGCRFWVLFQNKNYQCVSPSTDPHILTVTSSNVLAYQQRRNKNQRFIFGGCAIERKLQIEVTVSIRVFKLHSSHDPVWRMMQQEDGRLKINDQIKNKQSRLLRQSSVK